MNTASHALLLLRSTFGDQRVWARRVRQAVGGGQLAALGWLYGGQSRYIPDFLTPYPAGQQEAFADELHQVATAPASRVGPELDLVVTGSVKAAMPGAPLPRPLLGLIERGERPLAGHAAAEFDLFWRTALAPYWPDVRAALDADITYRAHLIARHGLTTMLSTLHPHITWDGSDLYIASPFHCHVPRADGLVLIPTVFLTAPLMSVDPFPGPARRRPFLLYPARPPHRDPLPTTAPPSHALLGPARAALVLSKCMCQLTSR
ncbi:hypothetical protein [Streptomyces tubercidicus]|uniref:hypothetical protein n=2 Tax=Streptomyces tubercidicus TaxID=47759 RepID=UPI002E12E535|nr:hypothetical protein OG761_02540 [Streptomyces tubercidicus]